MSEVKDTEGGTQSTAEQQQALGSRFDWRSILEKISYKGIVNNVPFLAFVVLLCVFYIANNHAAIETQRELDKQQRLLKELDWRNKDVKSKLMNVGMEAEVIRRSAVLGIKPLMLPAYKISLDTNKKKQ
jgi:hypothetical protein